MRWLPIFGIALLAQLPAGPPVPAAIGPIITAVSARDQSGRTVADLTTSDFDVFEGGVKQQVATFASVAAGTASPATGTAGRIFIVLIDDLNLWALDSPRVRDIMKQMRDRLFRDTDLIGVVSTGYSSIEQDLGYDVGHQRFNEAIKKVMGSPPGNTASPDDRTRAHVALATAHELLAKAGQTADRRKSFIYLSNGYDFGAGVASAYRAEQERYGREAVFVNPFGRPATNVSAVDLVADLAEVVRAARRANAALYPIDPRGAGGPAINVRISRQNWISQVQLTEGPLQLLAGETGGTCICLSNDFRTFLQRVDDETSDYYVIGYASTNRDPLTVQRNVEIKTSRPGVELAYRSEYFLPRAPR